MTWRAAMALGDKVEELQRTVATLLERVDTIRKLQDASDDVQRDIARELANLRREHAKELADLRREHEKELALLRREVEDLKTWRDDRNKERDDRSRRAWSFGPAALGAVINGLLAAAIAYFISRR
jgi:hypothetical protein